MKIDPSSAHLHPSSLIFDLVSFILFIPAFARRCFGFQQTAAFGAEELAAIVAPPHKQLVDFRVALAVAGIRAAALGAVADEDSIDELVGGTAFEDGLAKVGHDLGR